MFIDLTMAYICIKLYKPGNGWTQAFLSYFLSEGYNSELSLITLTRWATGRENEAGKSEGPEVGAILVIVWLDEWLSEQDRAYIISPLMAPHLNGHNSPGLNRERGVKYGVVYSTTRHIYESSLLYKCSDCTFKVACQPTPLSTTSCPGTETGGCSKRDKL